eukprot:TRINITY_DN10643_c0_g2_i1.p1 TRINITY_DN10643_c0_g2~~TRINITY_DN10643_c0_g2_i1.p1  ORF type:complete len:1646 (-),score=259.23 TRINITY_DN10643_c0_g2_i1:238-5175(-)
MQDYRTDLLCPISLELLDDPVSTPCCGHAFSRASLRNHLDREESCPLCRASIVEEFPAFDVDAVARNRTLAGLVEARRNASTNVATDSEKSPREEKNILEHEPRWNCSLTQVVARSGARLPVGRLKVEVDWPSYEADVCLFMPIIDRSGSMSGAPFNQVKSALMHMLHQTMEHRNVFTCIIPYNSSAEIMKVPRDGGVETARWAAMQDRVRNMRAEGGTNFSQAFSKIGEVLFGTSNGGKMQAQAFEKDTAEFEAQRRLGRQGLLVQGAPAFVKSVVIVFMTDGQDNAGTSREVMVKSFERILSKWTKDLVVHTVGFSAGHDFEFLNDLRKVGRTEGVFRYADPADGSDALCSKLSELTNAIVASTSLPVVFESLPFAVCGEGRRGVNDGIPPASGTAKSTSVQTSSHSIELHEGGRGCLRLFVEMGEDEAVNEEGNSDVLEISVPANARGEASRRLFSIPIKQAPGADVVADWDAYLVDEIVRETFSLLEENKRHASGQRPVAFRLHCALLLQRAKRLELHAADHADGALASRLALCVSQNDAMLYGRELSAARIGDALVAKPVVDTPALSTLAVPGVSVRCAHIVSSAAVKDGRGRVFRGRTGLTELHSAVLSGSLNRILETAKVCEDVNALDDEGDSALGMAASIGRLNVVRSLLANPVCQRGSLNKSNRQGRTPLELAAFRGHWKMVELLVEEGGELCTNDMQESDRAEHMIRELLQRRFYNTVARLVAAGLGSVTSDVLQNQVPPETLQWVMQTMADKQMAAESNAEMSEAANAAFLRRATENGMCDTVKSLVNRGVRPANAAQLGDLLLLCGSNSVAENGVNIAEILLQSTSGTNLEDCGLGEQVRIAADAGWHELLQMFLQRPTTDSNSQDGNGCTALSLACARRRMNCIVALLNAKADHSLADNDGSTPLMKSCLTNHCAAVAALLAAGAKPTRNVCTPGSDCPVTLCCRLGRPEILQMMLTSLARDEGQVVLRADLASVGALGVAAQSDQAASIRVLLAQRADPEAELPSDMVRVSSQATALHLAAHAGHTASARALLDGSAAVDVRDGDGRTPLHMAVQGGHILIVRLLRFSDADVNATDKFGRTPSGYCGMCGTVSDIQAIRSELVDPALDVLMEAARNHGKECCSVLSYAGLLGYLPARECVEVHGGDRWTPLMEAIACRNFEFAVTLLHTGADFRRRDCRGLSAAFWLQALYGADTVAALVEKLGQNRRSSEANGEVRCRDGVLQVGPEALAWMETNFPAVAAAVVPCATLTSTLRAKGFEVSDPEQGKTWAALSQAPLSHFISEPEMEALAQIRRAAKRDVRDGMILDMRFQDDVPVESDRRVCAFKMQMGNGRLSRVARDIPFELPKPRGDCVVVDFLQKLASDHKNWQVGKAAMTQLMASARFNAIGTLASDALRAQAGSTASATSAVDGKEELHLTMQQAFVLHVFHQDTPILAHVQSALYAGVNLDFWTPFVAAVLDALLSLPPVRAEVFRFESGPFEPELFSTGSVLCWSDFTSAASTLAALRPERRSTKDTGNAQSDGDSGEGVVFRIRSVSGRVFPAPWPTKIDGVEVVLLPRTSYRVIGRRVRNEVVTRSNSDGYSGRAAASISGNGGGYTAAALQIEANASELQEFGASVVVDLEEIDGLER